MDANSNTTPAPQAARKRVRVEYTADFAAKIDKLVESQNQLAIQVSTLAASVMPRHEIDSELEKRVTLGTYISDKAALEQRVERLENAPQNTWTRFSIIMSSGLGCISLITGSCGVVIGVISLIVSHPH